MTALTVRGYLELQETDWNDSRLRARSGDGARTRHLIISGEESAPPLTEAQAEHRRAEVAGLADSDEPVPVTWAANTDLDGWYRFTAADAALRRHSSATEVVQVPWRVQAERLGVGQADSALQSQLVGTTRTNDHGVGTGERWHALPAAAEGVYYGTSSPGELTRTTVDGDDVTVFRDIPDDTPARYLLAPGSAHHGTCRVRSAGGDHVGLSTTLAPASWELQNGLLRLRQDAAQAFRLAIADSSAWASELTWRVTRSTTALGVPDGVQVLRNDMHTAAVRLVWSESGYGAVTLDIVLRRGAFHASFVLRGNASTTMALEVNDGATATGTGYRWDSANDGDGNRWIVGSPDTIVNSNPTSWRGIQVSSGTELVGFLGIILGGNGATAGNAADDVRDQYLEDRAELVRVVAP